MSTRRSRASRRAGPVRRVRRPVRAGDPDPGAGRAGGRVAGAPRRPGVPRASSAASSRDFVGRPTPITYAARLSDELGYVIWLKREDLAHTGRAQDQQRARPGPRWRGTSARSASSPRPAPASTAWPPPPRARCSASPASSTWARRTRTARRRTSRGCSCWAPRSVPSSPARRTLKEAVNEALRDWAGQRAHHPLRDRLGRGAAPVPGAGARPAAGDRRRGARPVRRARSASIRSTCSRASAAARNAIGMFTAFVGAPGVELIGVEAGGTRLGARRHCASLTQGQPGVLHGALSYLLQDADGQVVETHSISAGLDYPGVGPEHAYLQDAGLARYVSATDDEALAGFQLLARTEGILPALEPSHVIGWLAAPRAPRGLADPGLPVGPRRQGPRHRARGAGNDLDGRTRDARCAPSATRRQDLRSRTSPAASRASMPRCCARSPTPAPTRSRSASRISDPIMDGGVVQEASRVALEARHPPARRAGDRSPRPTSTCRSP